MTDMKGIKGAKRLFADYLIAYFPEYLEWHRVERQLQQDELRDPARILPHEPQALTHALYPTIAIHGLRTLSINRRELAEPQSIIYGTTYSLRAFVWVCEQEWEPTITARDELTLQLRMFMLDRPSFDDGNAVIQEDEFTEDYSDVTKVKGDRYVAGAYIDFRLLVEETLTLTAPGIRSPSGIVEGQQPPGEPPPTSEVEETYVTADPIHPAFMD